MAQEEAAVGSSQVALDNISEPFEMKWLTRLTQCCSINTFSELRHKPVTFRARLARHSNYLLPENSNRQRSICNCVNTKIIRQYAFAYLILPQH